jgi:hypothetical protein
MRTQQSKTVVHYRSGLLHGLLFDCSFFLPAILTAVYTRVVEQERMANAQLLMYCYWSKHLEQNFFFSFFLKKCEFPMVLSDLEIPPDL